MELWCSVYSYQNQYYSKGITNPTGENKCIELVNKTTTYRMVYPCGTLEVEKIGKVVGYIISSIGEHHE